MEFCLPKNLVDLFLNKVKSGEITPDKLSTMSSQERRDYFKSFLGENNAFKVNSLFESKLLLKNQQRGIVNWVKKVSGMSKKVQSDMLSKVERMTEALTPENEEKFLSDFVEQRLGVGVTMEEAGKIVDLSKTVQEKRKLVTDDMPDNAKERLEYGASKIMFDEYVKDLKIKDDKIELSELLKHPYEMFVKLSGMAKSIAASFDNSFFGRQGFITLTSNPSIWAKNFMLSFKDIGKELSGMDAMSPVKAQIAGRKNAMNGKYKAIGVDVGITREEAFPEPVFHKIPLLGRLFKASDTAYNAGALRMRADLADAWIREAEALGVDINDKDANIGKAINFITGRGKLKLGEKESKFINAVLFSPRYLKSQIDILTAPLVYPVGRLMGVIPKEQMFARKKAAQYAVRAIGAIAGILTIAKLLDDESVELDPRSTKFGKIMVGSNHDIEINVSLGMGQIVTLASRLVPTMHNGRLGFWVKQRNGKYYDWMEGKYGKMVGGDLIYNFFKGKSAPVTRMLLNLFDAKNRKYEKPTLAGETLKLVTPIPVQSAYQLKESEAGEDALLYSILMALEEFGVGSNVIDNK